ncbi:hypothetical protein LQZ19_14765 [Treponema primitia]|uniref:hypothetical protein n=1 Tax=Treponema primitia TaxID=88058 RepID=UPI0039815B3B
MQEESKIFKEFGFIDDYSRWDDIINERVNRFYTLYRVHPNILLASGATFDRIDAFLRLHPENLAYSGEGEAPDFDGFSTFIGEDYTLEFCLDADQRENYFILVFDETPDFDGEAEPETEEEEPKFSYRIAG